MDNRIQRCAILLTAAVTASLSASAKCGGVDYSWGADALALMHDYVVTMMLYVLYLAYAVATIVGIYAIMQIYIKMNTGEEGIVKDILMVFGAVVFIISASIVFPAFSDTVYERRLYCRRDNKCN